MSVRDLIIVGAGPSGLAAAIAAKRRNLDYQVIEQGVLVNSIHRFPPYMVFFTTPDLLEIGGLPFITPFDKPTRLEALRYYRRVVDTYDLQIAFEEKVTTIEREDDVFAVETRSSRGVRRVRHATNVVLAIGYYDHPNMVNVPGEDLPNVHHYYSEPFAYYRQRVVIVGGANSAAEAALELYRAGAHVTLVHRAPALKSTIKYWVRPDIENRIKEGSIQARFNTCLKEIRPTAVIVMAGGPGETGGPNGLDENRMSERCPPGTSGVEEEIPADAVFLLTGYRADTELMVRAGVEMTDREGPKCDPETFETNVPGLYVAGGAMAGIDTGTVFIENGRFHGEKIVEVIARRLGEA